MVMEIFRVVNSWYGQGDFSGVLTDGMVKECFLGVLTAGMVIEIFQGC